MQRGRFIFAAALTLAAGGVWAANPPAPSTTPPAATTPAPAPKDVLNLDFSKTDVASQLQINGDAKLAMVSGKQVLRLTDGSGGQFSSVFMKTPVPPTGDYLATFDFQVQGSDANTPADGGFMYLVQTAGADHIGDAGSSGLNLGYAIHRQGPGTMPTEGFPGYSYGLAFSTLTALNFVDNPEVVELRVGGTDTRLNPTPFKMDGEGLLHASLRVKPDSLALTIQGGKDYATAKTVFTTPSWIGNGLFTPSMPVFFGFTGSDTGGQITDIFNLRVQSPAP
jgi:hypothetical protein